MEATITATRPDVVALETAPRPTAPPVRVPFSEVLSTGAMALVQGAQAAVRALPGAPVVAAAVRAGGLGPSTVLSATTTSPEGPTSSVGMGSMTSLAGAGMSLSGGGPPATPAASGAAGGDASIEGSLAQSQQMNLYYLQVQEQVNDQNRAFTLLSNVIEMEHNTAKSAIGNIH